MKCIPNLSGLSKYIWWILGFLVLPYFLYQKRHASWINPLDPKMLTIAYLSNFILPTSDQITDFLAGYDYFEKGDIWFCLITVGTMFLPFMAKLFTELIYSLQCLFGNDRHIYRNFWRAFLMDRLKNVFCQLPFVIPLLNLANLTKLSCLHATDLKTEQIMFKMGSQLSLIHI